MFDVIIRSSLRFRDVIYALVIVVACYGLYMFVRAELGVLPEFAPSMSIVHIGAPGLTNEQVETLVAQSLGDVLGGMVGLQLMRSRLMQGLSVIMLVFDDHMDVLQVR